MVDSASQKGKVLVIGASGGVGRCLVRQLLDKGYDVLGSALDQRDLDLARKDGLEAATLFVADFATAEVGMAQTRDALTQWGGSLDALISCVGIPPCGPVETTPLEVLRLTLEINTVSNVALYQLCLPLLRKTSGRMIFVSSVAGKVAFPLQGYYTASKFALEGMADAMRLEAGQWGVSVSLIEPGAIATGMLSGFPAQLDSVFAQLDPEGQSNYRDYFEQHKAFATNPDNNAVSPEVVAAGIVEVLEAEEPQARRPIGGAVDLLAQRATCSDLEMDGLINSILPGARSGA